MGSAAAPKHPFWRNSMAKTSLVHRFTRILLSPTTSKESSKAKARAEELEEEEEEKEEEEEEPTATPSYSKLTSRRRMRLEMDVERLHERLQQETELHSALENAITQAAGAFSTFPRHLPVHAQELLADVAMLEVAVSNLEKQMIGLEVQIWHERNERLRSAACQQTASPLMPKIKASQQEKFQEWQQKAYDFTERLSLQERMAEGSMLPFCDKGDVLQSNYSQPCNSTSEITSSPLEDIGRAPQISNSDEADHAMGGVQVAFILPRHMESDKGDVFQSNYSQPCTSTSEVTSCRLEDTALVPQISNSHEADRVMGGVQVASILPRHMDSDAEVEPAAYRFCKTLATGEDSEEASQSIHECTTNVDNADDGGTSSSSDNSVQLKLQKLWKQPNKLSQEMVSCVIGIYCHLADPSVGSSKHSGSDNVPSPSSPFEHITTSSFSSLSDLSNRSFARSPPTLEPKAKEEQSLDPYRTHDKLEWGDIGSYSSAVEVSWMSVGKEQLEYAANALRIFRSLVEQLSQVDATSLSHDEKLAFWINIYNALMMHAYLAYGFPKNDVKYFALMQKAAYTVGGHFFNAMAIEHVLLRGKAPSYRPQIALLLALHKVKIPEGASKFAISRPEPLVMFALSCGAWSSPAVRIYTPENVQAQLQAALHDYVRASVAIGRHGKVLVPKLIHCYARDLHMHKATGEPDEGRALVLWLSSFLPAHQANLLRNAAQQCSGRPPPPPTSALISVQPFNFRLRYVFLHQSGTQK